MMVANQAPSSRQPPPPPPPPTPGLPNDQRIRRYKLAWRVFMIANLGLGAYMFAMAKKRTTSMKSEPPPVKKDPPSPSTAAHSPNEDLLEERELMPSIPIAKFVKGYEHIPEDQQREAFEWILDEKRKVKPANKAEKKKIDEEKAILKKFIRAESVPRF